MIWRNACLDQSVFELATRREWHHIGAMNQEQLTRRVRAALRAAPCSIRELAKHAGIPHSTLVRIAREERLATVVVAERVGKALAEWGKRCLREAQRVQNAVESYREGV